MIIPSKLYDILKWCVLTLMPALIVLVNAVLPSVGVSAETIKTITTIISALATFIGTIIGVSSLNYAKTDYTNGSTSTSSDDTDFIQSFDEVQITSNTAVEFHGKMYTLTGKDIQILASYPYSDEEYDYVEYLYGDGQTATKKSKAFKTDAEREAHYNKITEMHADWYPVKWPYDATLTLAENFTIAKGQKTKEQILQEDRK